MSLILVFFVVSSRVPERVRKLANRSTENGIKRMKNNNPKTTTIKFTKAVFGLEMAVLRILNGSG